MAKALITLGQLIDQTVDLYRDAFARLMRISLFLFLTSFLFAILSIGFPMPTELFLEEVNWSDFIPRIVAQGVFLLIIVPVISAWVYAELIALTDQVVTKPTSKKDPLMRNDWLAFFKYLIAGTLLGILLFIPLLVIIPGLVTIIYAFPLENGATLSMIGVVLFFAGILTALALVILLGVRFAFIGFEIIVKKTGIIDSFKKSWRLVKGRFFRTFILLAVPTLLITVAQMICQMVLFMGFAILVSSLPAMSTSGANTFGDILGNLVGTGLTVLFLPLYVVVNYLVFRSLEEVE